MSPLGRVDLGTAVAPVLPIIDAGLVRRLIAAQFPHWADLPVRPVTLDGWDNRTFRLGEEMTVRLPSAAGYAPQVDKEHRWLPVLAPQLPLPIPASLACGTPGEGFPFRWSVRSWLKGEAARIDRIGDLTALAASLGAFLAALQRIDAADGPPAGLHSAFRGAPLETYDHETRRAIAAVCSRIVGDEVTAVWDAGCAAPRHATPVWFHGDVAAGNLLVQGGRLAAVIDFGCCGVGDPACDLTIAWTLFSGASREAFKLAIPTDASTWARGRGWALWKALITLAEQSRNVPAERAAAARVIDDVLDDHRRGNS